MNPPSAIHGAMGRERKPFTYTPGGLDLSEIKSERMAKRLMRNAMNQGVPELPAQSIQSPPTPSTPIAVPNFNCLPVQVFPTFALPANPKSLLRTRSTPDQQREPPIPKVTPPSQIVNSYKPSGIEQLRETINNNTQSYSSVNNNNYNSNRPAPVYEYNTAPNNSLMRTSYGSDAYTAPVLPEISYDVEYFQAPIRNNNNTAPPISDNDRKSSIKDSLETLSCDFTVKPLSESNTVPAPVTKCDDDDAGADDDEQKEVKVVKKQVKKEKQVESQNGDENGVANAEAEMTVKLPTKKSAAKTETKVEVVKKVLPDGSVEEIKTTTTRTTVDGKTEIRTKTETTIIPKEEEDEEVEEEEEEEDGEVVVQEVTENGQKEKVVEEPTTVIVKKTIQEAPKETKVVKKEERSETTTTKKVTVVQKSSKQEEQDAEEEEEEEEVEEAEPVVIKQSLEKTVEKPSLPQKSEVEDEEEEEVVEEQQEQEQVTKVVVKKQVTEEEEEEDGEAEEVEIVQEVVKEIKKEEPKEDDEEEVEEEEEFEEAEEPEEKPVPKVEKPVEPVQESKVDEESEYTEEEIESEKEERSKPAPAEVPKPAPVNQEPVLEETTQEEKKEEKQEPVAPPAEQKVPLREPSIPLEKVEDVEIKPIGETVTKSHSESTEIITSASKPAGIQSTQTEYNRIENIVTVNRTTKTLDHSYEQLTQQGIPTVKTYFAPDRERVSTSPQPSRPYQPIYPTSQQQPERRHSLLLERLSTERQMPSEIYQNNFQANNQSYEQQRQWSQEPQSEVINVSNVKPSTITNQQWYQQNRKENAVFNNVLPTSPATPSQQWSQPQPQSQTQYQTSYTENTSQDTSRISSNSYPSYTPKPTNWATNNLGSTLPLINTQSNQYSYLNKDSESYQQTTQQYSSGYVPPPWEQDPSYVAPELPVQTNYYQPPPPANTFSPASKPGWKPAPPPGKFSKPQPTAYVPPAPNQSFVKSVNVVVEPPKLPGRKTYYSEYERRYITVPESTYIPSETAKFQPQPDPSPQYYYDNNEPSETVEHEWRKELREFTEKTSQTQILTDQTSVKPPWEEDPKYAKVPTVTYTPTPSWSQTLRPQNCRERSFESEYISTKTNTLGRGRPLSSYGNATVEASIPERVRGVSVDRYNPNNYQPPITSEHGPVQTHTLIPTPSQGYHNPNVPAYHARASAEPREQSASIPQPRQWGESRTTPIQSRSFKYLQWITGTED